MNRLWVRLTLAFALVTLVAVFVAAVLVNGQISARFRQFVAHNQMVDSLLIDNLTGYYTAHGSWAGVETVFGGMERPGMGGHGPMGAGMMNRMPNLTLADAGGRIVYSQTGRGGQRLNRREQTAALPLEANGQTIGYLVIAVPPPSDLTAPARAFLGQVNRSLLQAGWIAGTLGVLLGLLIARGLTAPLARLAAATRRISQGEFDHRVPAQGAQEVAELAHAFNDMAAALQEAETLRRNMVADVAHELRTPLSVLQGNLRAILDDVYPLDKAEIARLYDQTRLLGRLVHDLRELALADAGQLTLNRHTVDIAALANDTLAAFAPVAEAEQITLHAELPPDLPPLQADATRLKQVLHNLLANALRHTPAGGTVTLRGGTEGNSVWLAVHDTGEGIAPQDLPHVFDRFYRADPARSRATGGAGLGLAIARAIVEAHGGQLTVASEGVPGRGTTFTLRLPLSPPPPPAG